MIALPSHTSHALQPLDISVFNSFKASLKSLFRKTAHLKKDVDVLDVAMIIKHAYSSSFNSTNIMDGFVNAGLWDASTLLPNISMLEHLPFYESQSDSDAEHILPSLDELLDSFRQNVRALLQPIANSVVQTVQVNTSRGLHVTSHTIMKALEERDNRS